MVKALMYIQWNRNTCNPCLYYKWIKRQLVAFLLWVDNCLVVGPQVRVCNHGDTFFVNYINDTADEGKMKEYVGCKIERTNEYLKMTQLVKVQRLIDEFGYNGSKSLSTPFKRP